MKLAAAPNQLSKVSSFQKGPVPPYQPPIGGRWHLDQNLAAFVYL